MKFEIFGFSQQKIVDLQCQGHKLDVNDMLLLRWFADFSQTNKMYVEIIDGKVYYWVNYSYVLEQLPMLSIGKRTLANKFQKMVKAGILSCHVKKQGGTYTMYAFDDGYTYLISDNNNTAQQPEEQPQQPAPEKEQPKQQPQKQPASPKKEPQIPYEEIKHKFNYMQNLVPILELTPKRKNAIKKYLKAHSIDELYNLFAMANDTPFLTGQNERGWKADFDWLLKPENALKVLEGKYKTVPKQQTNQKNKFQNFESREYNWEALEQMEREQRNNQNDLLLPKDERKKAIILRAHGMTESEYIEAYYPKQSEPQQEGYSIPELEEPQQEQCFSLQQNDLPPLPF